MRQFRECSYNAQTDSLVRWDISGTHTDGDKFRQMFDITSFQANPHYPPGIFTVSAALPLPHSLHTVTHCAVQHCHCPTHCT